MFSAYTYRVGGGEEANLHKVSHAGTHRQTHMDVETDKLSGTRQIELNKNLTPHTHTRAHTHSAHSQCGNALAAHRHSHSPTQAHEHIAAAAERCEALALSAALFGSHTTSAAAAISAAVEAESLVCLLL